MNTPEEFLKKEGYFDSPHFPFEQVAGLMHRYSLSQSGQSAEKGDFTVDEIVVYSIPGYKTNATAVTNQNLQIFEVKPTEHIEPVPNFKIKFTDCWEVDKRIDAKQRWMAAISHLKIVVTASTKEKAFDEIMTSIRVLAMFQNDIAASQPNDAQNQDEEGNWTRVILITEEEYLHGIPRRKIMEKLKQEYSITKNQ